jgi:hypothetical protein
MRRRRLLVGLAGLAVVVAAGVVVLWPYRTFQGDWPTYCKIETGMTRVEVEAVFGVPPGDYRTKENYLSLSPPPTDTMFRTRVWPPPGSVAEEWEGDAGKSLVAFDPAGRVVATWYMAYMPREQTRLEAIVWRVNRQWHRWFP